MSTTGPDDLTTDPVGDRAPALAPALDERVQRIANLAFLHCGLIPLVRESDDETTCEVALLYHQDDDPEREAEWIIVFDRHDQGKNLTLYGMPDPADGPDAYGRSWTGADQITEALLQHATVATRTSERRDQSFVSDGTFPFA